MTEDFYSFLEERIKNYLRRQESLQLLREILDWHEEGGVEMVESRLRSRIILTVEGYKENVS